MAEETGNNKTFKDLVAEQKRTTEEQKKTTTAIRHQMMTAEEIAEEESESRKKSEARIEGGRKSWETRQANLMAKNNPNSASGKEKTKESNSYLRNTFKYFLGKNSFFAKGFSSIANSLKKKVGGGIAGIFKALKAGAFILFLAGLKKFLESEKFKEMLDNILDFIENPSWKSFTEMFTGAASPFIIALGSIVALMNPLTSLKLLRVAVKSLIAGTGAFARGISMITGFLTGGDVDAQGRKLVKDIVYIEKHPEIWDAFLIQ